MPAYTTLANGTYHASTYTEFYSLTLESAANVLLSAPGGSVTLYDESFNAVGAGRGTPVLIEAGSYVVKVNYSSLTYGVFTVYVPSQPAFDSLLDLASGSYKASSYVNPYALNLGSPGNLFVVASGDSSSAVIYDRHLNFVAHASGEPLHLEAANYIVIANYNGYRNGMLTVNVSESMRTDDTSLLPASPLEGNNTFTGSLYADLVSGLSGNDRFTGYSDYGVPDQFFGGGGVDAAVYRGVASDYSIEPNAALSDLRKPTGTVLAGMAIKDLVSGRDGTDNLFDVERLHFSDKAIAFDIDGHAGQAYRLYRAAFDRVPDKPGLGFQMNALDVGFSLQQIAQNFLDSPEFQSRYGPTPSDGGFITQLYANVLHRSPDAGGFSYQVNALHDGMARAQMLINFSESPENYQATLVGVQNGIEFVAIA